MKKVAVYAISILSLTVLLSTCYYVSYRYALNEFNKSATEQSGGINGISVSGAYDVAAKAKTVVSKDATYTEQTYDMATDKLKEKEKNIPNDFIGLTRDQVVAKMNAYVQDKSLQEYNKGLVSYQIVSFSSDKIVAKKTYNSKGIIYQFFMVIRDNELVVYYSDKKTVYDDETGILLDNLPEDKKQELQYGKYVKDEKELNSVLESYAS